jgi:hypothetical protein
MRLPELIDALEARDWKVPSESFIKVIADKLWLINGELVQAKRDLAAAEAACEVWKQSFQEQVKYNIQMQVENFKEKSHES